jgi:hypothetical protein
MYPYVIIALDLARERAEEQARMSERSRLLIDSMPDAGPRAGWIRHPVARVLAAFSRGSAAVVRRLDDCVADDLGRTLAPTE